MVTLQPKTFNSTPRIVARLTPFTAAPPLCETGPIIGFDILNRQAIRFNPWELRLKGTIQATVFRLIATLGGGKTALYMMLAMRLLEMAAGVDELGNPKLMTGRIEENKHEKFQSAFTGFAETTAANLIQMNQLRSLNPFAYMEGMNELDMLARVLRTVKIQNYGKPLTPLGNYAMQVGVHTMFKHRDASGPGQLRDILWNANGDDKGEYDNFIEQSFMEDSAKLFAENEALREEVVVRHSRQTSNLTDEEFRIGCREAMLFPDQLLSGDYGNSFGEGQGLPSIMADSLTVLDWLDVPDMARGIITSAMWQLQTIATRDASLAHLIPNFVFSDEAGKGASNESQLEYRAAAAKDARAYPTFLVEATQFEQEDLIQIGEEGSRARALASASERAVGGRFIGPIGKLSPAVLRYTASLGIERHEAYFMSGMPTGCFAIVIPNQPLRYVQVVPRPNEWPMIYSDSAAAGVLAYQDQHFWTAEEIIENAERVNQPDEALA